jgi:hypothetical protein
MPQALLDTPPELIFAMREPLISPLLQTGL